jgi:hypothetical protein
MDYFNRLVYAIRRLAFPLGALSVQLITADQIVLLRGISPSEREEASMSYLRGVIRVKVHRSSIKVDAINVRFIGECVDTVYVKEFNKRLLSQVRKTLINDTFKYSNHSSELLKGTYTIPFQFIIDPHLPESVNTALGSRRYHLEVEINNPAGTMIHRPITMIRTPIDCSLIANANVEASGQWRGIMPYYMSLSSKICQLGSSFELNVETHPNPMLGISGYVKFVKVMFVQKLKCPKKNDDPTGDPEHYSIIDQDPLFFQKFSMNKDPYDPFKLKSKVDIPKSLSFNAHPYTSNRDISDAVTIKELRITHYIHVYVGIHPISISDDEDSTLKASLTSLISNADKSQIKKMEHSRADIIFKAPVYLLAAQAMDQYEAPPQYGNNDAIGAQKSLSWLCTNGQYDDGLPPRYKR